MVARSKPMRFGESLTPFTYANLENGIPASAVRELEQQGLRRADIRMVIPDRTLERRIAAGQNLKPEEADGIARLMRVLAGARGLFENDENADIFLHSPNPALGGQIPMEMARTDLGAREVETIIGRIAYGVFS
jgi:putative toxin-antitoxin system antitoxin component (TIGR02293 family)